MFLALFIVILGHVTSGKPGDVHLRFGLMEPDESGEYYVSTETTHIPLCPSEYEPEFRFGYTLEFLDGRVFSSYFVLSLPAPPKVIGGSLVEATRSGDGRVLTSAPMFYQERSVEAFAFNESDPLGRWKVDIYVEDTLLRSIRFTVVSPDKMPCFS
jgi:hypothetical protein